MPLTAKSLRGCLYHNYVSRFVEQSKVYGSAPSDLQLYQEIAWHVIVKYVTEMCQAYQANKYSNFDDVFITTNPAVFSKWNIQDLLSGKDYLRPTGVKEHQNLIDALYAEFKSCTKYQAIMDLCEKEYSAYLEHEASLLDTPRINEAVLAEYDRIEKELSE
jgi:hypothetical protein